MKITWKMPLFSRLHRLLGYLGCSVRKLLVLVLLLSALSTLLLLVHWDVVCTNYELSSVSATLCSLYKDGVAMGDMCHAICVSKSLVPDSCEAWHGGKEVVFSAFFRGNPVYIKGRKLDFTSDRSEEIQWRDDAGVEHFPSQEEFHEMVQSYLMTNLNIPWQESTMYKLWPHAFQREHFSEKKNEKLFRNSVRNIWALLLDNEYVFSRLYEHYDVFPELYGTCGGFYAVERLVPLEFPSLLESISFGQWAGRVRIALSILDLLEELESMFDHSVHLCDVKADHFGMSENNRVKYMDVDTVYFQPTIDKAVGDGANCSTHTECNFFDCRGQCDLMKGKCLGGVVNNNLQVVCEKVFLGRGLGLKMLGGTGLLASRHMDNKLRSILQSCANPSGAKDDVRLKAKESVGKELRKSLTEVLHMQVRLAESEH